MWDVFHKAGRPRLRWNVLESESWGRVLGLKNGAHSGDLWRSMFGLAWLLTVDGMPRIFHGQEHAMNGICWKSQGALEDHLKQEGLDDITRQSTASKPTSQNVKSNNTGTYKFCSHGCGRSRSGISSSGCGRGLAAHWLWEKRNDVFGVSDVSAGVLGHFCTLLHSHVFRGVSSFPSGDSVIDFDPGLLLTSVIRDQVKFGASPINACGALHQSA